MKWIKACLGAKGDPGEQGIQGEKGEQGDSGDYNTILNKPKIAGVELKNDKTFKDLGLENLSNIEIENLINLQV